MQIHLEWGNCQFALLATVIICGLQPWPVGPRVDVHTLAGGSIAGKWRDMRRCFMSRDICSFSCF